MVDHIGKSEIVKQLLVLIAIFTAFTLGYYAFEGETDTQIKILIIVS